MPIGFDRGDFGGGSGLASGSSRPTRPRATEQRPTPVIVGPPEPEDHHIYETATRPAWITTIWTRWITASDERTCPECAPLEGATWPQNEGPHPPLHGNCRCTRTLAFIEVTSR